MQWVTLLMVSFSHSDRCLKINDKSLLEINIPYKKGYIKFLYRVIWMLSQRRCDEIRILNTLTKHRKRMTMSCLKDVDEKNPIKWTNITREKKFFQMIFSRRMLYWLWLFKHISKYLGGYCRKAYLKVEVLRKLVRIYFVLRHINLSGLFNADNYFRID